MSMYMLWKLKLYVHPVRNSLMPAAALALASSPNPRLLRAALLSLSSTKDLPRGGNCCPDSGMAFSEKPILDEEGTGCLIATWKSLTPKCGQKTGRLRNKKNNGCNFWTYLSDRIHL